MRHRPQGGSSAWQGDPLASSRSFRPLSAAERAGRPQTLAMRPLLLLAPLGWLLLAEAKGDAKPEGEGAAPAGRGIRGGAGAGGLSRGCLDKDRSVRGAGEAWACEGI